MTVVFGDGTGAFDDMITINVANNAYNNVFSVMIGDYSRNNVSIQY